MAGAEAEGFEGAREMGGKRWGGWWVLVGVGIRGMGGVEMKMA